MLSIKLQISKYFLKRYAVPLFPFLFHQSLRCETFQLLVPITIDSTIQSSHDGPNPLKTNPNKPFFQLQRKLQWPGKEGSILGNCIGDTNLIKMGGK